MRLNQIHPDFVRCLGVYCSKGSWVPFQVMEKHHLGANSLSAWSIFVVELSEVLSFQGKCDYGEIRKN